VNEDYRDFLGVTVSVLGVEDLVTNKLASGREKDRADVRGLEGRN
jgi:hypothetical protein